MTKNKKTTNQPKKKKTKKNKTTPQYPTGMDIDAKFFPNIGYWFAWYYNTISIECIIHMWY